MSPPVTVSCLANAGGLQRRYIQKCKISDLYWQFQAEWATLSEAHEQFGRDIPSYDTFRRRWNSHWCGMLHMREKSQHKQCQICFDLQLCLHSPTVPLSTKMEAAKTLRRHQAEQYEDRMLYWSLRFASQAQSHGMSEDPLPACGSSSVLTIIIDDMDHSKFAWPKFPFRKSPAEMENLIRPTVTFTGAIAHGWGTYLYMANPNVMGGSDYFCEVLCQTIQNVWRACNPPDSPQSDSPPVRRRVFPAHLVVIADNTVKSAKNQFVLRFLSYLVGKKLFKSATLFHLMEGHTHEDIDQLFAVVFSIMKKKQSWQTPEEILEHIRTGLQSCSQILQRGELVARHVTGVRNFDAWLQPMKVELHNAFKARSLNQTPGLARVEVPHCYTFVAGDSMPAKHRDLLPEGVNPFAVYVCVKMYVRDLLLSQPPLLMCTPERLQRILAGSPPMVHAMVPLTDAQIKTWSQIADLCAGKYGLPNAAHALNAMMVERRYHVIELTFLMQPPRHFIAVPDGNAQLPCLPSTCWRLMARFKR
ncbi:unnamed protein product [Symbiodinium natans]|uniref:DUF7869 domain-containing protein n=1 Tax=Symbiodinium natans TaxID=878477 RepID=A0A812PD77_9DINO|nr:unnamed protein product [Symbiodinium natans]